MEILRKIDICHLFVYVSTSQGYRQPVEINYSVIFTLTHARLVVKRSKLVVFSDF